MRRGTRIAVGLAILLAGGVLLAACNPLRTFDALVPKDEVGALARDVAYGTEARQKLDIYLPVGRVADRPVVIFVHGGSWATGTKDGYRWAGRALASLGYVTVVPDYRLVPEVRYPGFVEDVAAALAWTRAEIDGYGGDPERIAIAGHSAGGYNALMAALTDGFAAGSGPGAVKAIVSLSSPTDFLPLDTRSTIDAFGNVNAGRLPATQPVNRVSVDSPPVLIIHGTADETVKPRHATALRDAYEAAGAQAVLRLYESINHRDVVLGLSRPFRGRVGTLRDVDEFLKSVL